MTSTDPTFGDFVRALRRRAFLVLPLIVLAPVLAYVLSAAGDDRFRATTDVVLNERLLVAAGVSSFGEEPGRTLQTQLRLARSPGAAQAALRQAGRNGGSVKEFLDDSDAKLRPGADVIALSADADSREDAQRLSAAYARGYVDFRTQLEEAALERAKRAYSASIERAEGAESLRQALIERAERLRASRPLRGALTSLVPADARPEKVAPNPLRNAILAFLVAAFLAVVITLCLEALRRPSARAGTSARDR